VGARKSSIYYDAVEGRKDEKRKREKRMILKIYCENSKI